MVQTKNQCLGKSELRYYFIRLTMWYIWLWFFAWILYMPRFFSLAVSGFITKLLYGYGTSRRNNYRVAAEFFTINTTPLQPTLRILTVFVAWFSCWFQNFQYKKELPSHMNLHHFVNAQCTMTNFNWQDVSVLVFWSVLFVCLFDFYLPSFYRFWCSHCLEMFYIDHFY